MDEKPEATTPATTEQDIGDTEDSTSFTKRLWKSIWSFLKDHWRQLTVGVLLAIFAFALTARWDHLSIERQQRFEDQRFKRLQEIEDYRHEHQEILENTRFARQLSLTDGPKPLSHLNLRRAELSGLNLSGADLRSADLTGAHLTGADLRSADLREAVLPWADIRGTDLAGADLTDARFENNIDGLMTVRGICYDSSTVWPEGYEVGEDSMCFTHPE